MFVLLFLCFVSAWAAPTENLLAQFPGPCPEINQVDNFNNDGFAGAWYQLYHEKNDRAHRNDSHKCIERRYTLSDDKKHFSVEKYYVLDRRPVWQRFQLELTDRAGVFRHPTVSDPIHENVEVKMVSVKYDSYAVAWGCKYNEETNTHLESGGIVSRTNGLPDGELDRIHKFFADHKSEIEFSRVDFSDCRVRCE